MDREKIKAWMEDTQIIEKHEISGSYHAVIRHEQEFFMVYTVTNKDLRLIDTVDTLQDAREAVATHTDRHLAWLKKRRLKAPTPAQLGMLFRWKIPIPIDLTFGQAWDIIDARMEEEKQRKQKRA